MIRLISEISRTDIKNKRYENVKMKNMQDVPTESGKETTVFLSPMIALMASALKK